jgi:hypothetical protein
LSVKNSYCFDMSAQDVPEVGAAAAALHTQPGPALAPAANPWLQEDIQPPVFDGNSLSYTLFTTRLNVFRQQLLKTGKFSPRQIFLIVQRSCFNADIGKQLKGALSYGALLRELKMLVDEPDRIIWSFENIVHNWSDVVHADEGSVETFVNNVMKLERVAVERGYSGYLYSESILRLILGKAADPILDLFFEHAVGIQAKDHPKVFFNFIREYSKGGPVKERPAPVPDTLQVGVLDPDPPPGEVGKQVKRKQSGPENGGKNGKFTCPAKCKVENRHELEGCEKFRKCSNPKQWGIIRKNNLCLACFSADHFVSSCPGLAGGESAGVGQPAQLHPLLVASSLPSTQYRTVCGRMTSHHKSKNGVAYVPMQEVVAINGMSANLMIDGGSQVSLISAEAATRLGALIIDDSHIKVEGIGGGVSFPDKLCRVSIRADKGTIFVITAHIVKELRVPAMDYDHEVIEKSFEESYLKKLSLPTGMMDIVMGNNNGFYLPIAEKVVDNLTIAWTPLNENKPYVLMGMYKEGGIVFSGSARVGDNFVPLDFISAEALGTDMPRRCKSCNNCKECAFRATTLTAQENHEYKIILDNLKYDPVARRWSTTYPFVVSPTILRDNYGQAAACLRSLEAQLMKRGRLAEFDQAFKEIIDRGVFRELTSEEVNRYKGPVNYISTVAAYKSGPNQTTPLRICMNSSMKQPAPVNMSLNDLLYKGPSALADLYIVTLGFREYRYQLIKDISKFYNTILADEVAQHTRRVLWRSGNTDVKPKIYITTTVNFGDKPAGCIAIAAVRETADKFGGKSPAAWFLKNRTYVDDATAGSNTREGLSKISSEIEKICEMGGFKFKQTHQTGDPVEGEPIKVLGLIWDTETDRLKVDIKVNFAGKRGGAKLGPDLDLETFEEEIDDKFPDVITKRIVWRIAQGQYDPLGLVSPYMVKLKLLMRKLTKEDGKVTHWDTPVSPTISEDFKQVILGLAKVREITFPRSIQPSKRPGKPPILMVFGDGSMEAICAVAYIRWECMDGSVECKLLTAKTRVAPKQVITIPRMELTGAILAVRLASKVKQTFQFSFDEELYFTDSSVLMGMLDCETDTFTEFVANRVSEIKSKTSMSQWAWVPTDCNPSDLGTRSQVSAIDMHEDSWYQKGMDWMYRPREEWPTKKTFKTLPPSEERRKPKAMANAQVATEKVAVELPHTKVSKAIRVKAAVMTAVQRWRRYKKIEGKKGALKDLQEGRYKLLLDPDCFSLQKGI